MGRVVGTRRASFKVITARVPAGVVEAIDALIERGYFQNRSDAFREALRRLVIDYNNNRAAPKQVATIR
ncbi:MAG: ribbon-helix-helix domain-containing protein [Thermofilaceae archaeon]